MAPDTDELRHEIEQAREALGEHLEELATRAEHVVDVRYQIRAHPWETAAAAISVGFLLGRIGNGTGQRPSAEVDVARGPGPQESALSWIADDLDVLLDAAARAAIRFLRDTIRREAPALGASVDRVYEERARRLR